MILGLDKIRCLVDDPSVRLIENLSDREITNPEGAGIDLRIGRLSKFLCSESFLGVDVRSTLNTEVVLDIALHGEVVATIPPGGYFLATTIERINMPLGMVGLIRPRGTLFRSGITLSTGQVNPGYSGEQTFGLHNAGGHEFKIQLGARIAHIVFLAVDGETSAYRGQWNNGRISAPTSESQV